MEVKMKRLKILIGLALSLSLIACNNSLGQESQNQEPSQVQVHDQGPSQDSNAPKEESGDLQDLIDQDPNYTQDAYGDIAFVKDLVSLNDMDQEEKDQAYARMDQVGKIEHQIDYKTLESNYGDAFYHINLEDLQGGIQGLVEDQSYKEPLAIYINFFDCPYCQAFSPKLAKFATDYGIQVYSFNSHLQPSQEDLDFVSEFFNPSTVPVVYLVYEGQIQGVLDHETSSQAMEYFFDYMVNLQN